jgi:indolepyruvate decarboxylase
MPARARTRPGAEPETTIGQYLIDRLSQLGVRHVFGIPGDYVLGLFKMLEESPLRLVGTATELGAGFAADAYARINGLGAACVTYAVGGLNLANATACAYAEKSPVVVISGAPALRERKPNLFLHHMVQGYTTQYEVFQKVTAASCVLDDPLTAFREIDRVLGACLRYKRPVYIELPRDRLTSTMVYPHTPLAEKPRSEPEVLAEAVAEATTMLRASRRPVIIVGIEVHRFGLASQVLRLAEASGIPLAALLLSKAAVPENHPLYAGIYGGGMGRPEVIDFVEGSDCVLMLGAILNDIDSSTITKTLDESRIIFATTEQVRIRHHHYQGILLADFIEALTGADVHTAPRPLPPKLDPIYAPWQARGDEPITCARLFQKINALLSEELVVVADVGDCLFGAADLSGAARTDFVAAAFYASMGFAVPAEIGVQCAAPRKRPLVLVGDGAFQMTGLELTTALRQQLNPIVVVLNNGGYGTERFILEGSFNDIHNWNYHRLPDLLGGGLGFEVRTEGELEEAMDAALANCESYTLLNTRLGQHDTSPALRRLAARFAKKV